MNKVVDRIKKNVIVINSIYSVLAKGCAMLMFFMIDIFSARILGNREYGEWAYFYAIITVVYSIVWFGENISSKIYIAKASKENRAAVLYAAIKLRFKISIVGIGVYTIISYILLATGLFDIQKYPHLPELFLAGGILIFFNSFTEFFKEIFVGFIDFRKVFIVNFIEYSGYLIFGIAGIKLLKGIFGLFIGFCLAVIIATISGFYLCIKQYGVTEVKPEKSFVKDRYSEIFRYGKYIALSSIGVILLTEIDTFMIGYLLNDIETGIYSIAKQLSSKAIHVNLALSSSMMTAFATLTFSNINQLKNKFKNIMLFNGLVTGLITIGFIAAGKYVILLLYGKEYFSAGIVLYCLMPYYIMSSFSKFLVLFLDYQNKAKERSRFYFVTIIIDVILNYIFIPKFGSLGAAIATDLSVVPYFLFLIYEVKKIFYHYLNKKLL